MDNENPPPDEVVVAEGLLAGMAELFPGLVPSAEAFLERFQKSQERVQAAFAVEIPPNERVSKYDNPYLEKFFRSWPHAFADNWLDRLGRSDSFWSHDARDLFTHRYAWAVPTDEAIDLIAQYSPLIEIGAGTGYWASLLRQAGADTLCFDAHPPNLTMRFGDIVRRRSRGRKRRDRHHGVNQDPDEQIINVWHGLHDTLFHPVEIGGPPEVARYPDRNLLLCWPPFDEPMGFDALSNFTGEHVIYIGENGGGCTADAAFHRLLEAMYEAVDVARLPQWFGIHDNVYVYRRLKDRPGKSDTEVGAGRPPRRGRAKKSGVPSQSSLPPKDQ